MYLSKIRGSVRHFVVLAMGALLMMGILAGCSSNDGGSADDQGQSSTSSSAQAEGQSSAGGAITPDSRVFQLLNQLTAQTTLEQANEIIGSEGELIAESDSASTYVWIIDDDTSIEGILMSGGSANYSADYPTKLVADRADFSKWDEIEAQQKAGSLTYDQLVELVGGVPGLKDEIRSGACTYQWYDADGGYLFAQVDDETGEISVVSGRF